MEMSCINNEFLVSKETVVLSKSFTVVVQPLSTRLIKPNFCINNDHLRDLNYLFIFITSLTFPCETNDYVSSEKQFYEWDKESGNHIRCS